MLSLVCDHSLYFLNSRNSGQYMFFLKRQTTRILILFFSFLNPLFFFFWYFHLSIMISICILDTYLLPLGIKSCFIYFFLVISTLDFRSPFLLQYLSFLTIVKFLVLLIVMHLYVHAVRFPHCKN